MNRPLMTRMSANLGARKASCSRLDLDHHRAGRSPASTFIRVIHVDSPATESVRLCRRPPAGRRPAGILADRAVRGSVLVIVMITVLFATFALVAFLEKAGNDLLVDQREVLTRRLRKEAYSALEVTLAVLEDFREVGSGLRSPNEGWNDPLGFAGYTPADGLEVQVTFEDESGKISLPRANAQVLTMLFRNWEVRQQEAEALADALMGWMHPGHVYGAAMAPQYDQSPLPYEAPGRPLRSFQELAAIDTVRETFYDANGRPNELWQRFADSVSLFDFQRANVNGARPDTLAAVGQFDATQQQNLTDYLRGEGPYRGQGPAFFRSPNEAQQLTGPTGNTGAFGATISALRVNVTVIDGRTQFRLSTVIAPPGGATTVTTNASTQRTRTSASAAKTASQRQNQPSATKAGSTPAGAAAQKQAERNLRYPFTLLEIRENAEISSAPPPPAADSLI